MRDFANETKHNNNKNNNNNIDRQQGNLSAGEVEEARVEYRQQRHARLLALEHLGRRIQPLAGEQIHKRYQIRWSIKNCCE